MIIKKGTHAPFRLPKLLIKPKALRYEVEFTESCRYRFGTDDDADVNKLFGISFITFGSFWFVIKNLFKGKVKALHHYNSVRFGWRYDALSNRFEVLYYVYQNGERLFNHMISRSANQPLNMRLNKVDVGHWSFFYEYGFDMPKTWLCYELHPYFGGNRTAPHDMEIKMKRL